MPGCTYEGYCDYQTPRDSRPVSPIAPYIPPTFGPPPFPLPGSTGDDPGMIGTIISKPGNCGDSIIGDS